MFSEISQGHFSCSLKGCCNYIFNLIPVKKMKDKKLLPIFVCQLRKLTVCEENLCDYFEAKKSKLVSKCKNCKYLKDSEDQKKEKE